MSTRIETLHGLNVEDPESTIQNPFLVTECRFQDTHGCSENVCRQAEKKWKLPCCFLVNIRKESTCLHPGIAYTGTWCIVGKDNPQGVGKTAPKRSQSVKDKVTFSKNGKNKKVDAILVLISRILVGRQRENRPTFCEKNMLYHPVSVHHHGWVGFAIR